MFKVLIKTVIFLIVLIASVDNHNFPNNNLARIIQIDNWQSFDSLDAIENLQHEIILKRNLQCLFEKYGGYLKVNDSIFQQELQLLFQSFDEIDLINEEKLAQIFFKKCLPVRSIAKLLPGKENFTTSHLNLIKIVHSQIFNFGCDFCQENQSFSNESKQQVWLYGFVSVTLITFTSFSGALLYPLLKYKVFKKILMFLVSLAAGTLLGIAFLHLIPQAFGIEKDINYASNNHCVWISFVVLCGVYFFFLIEQLMKMYMSHRKLKKNKKEKKLEPKVVESNNSERNSLLGTNRSYTKKISNVSSDGPIEPIAWIIIIGELLHNLLDGLSIGCAFSQGIFNGFSLSIAVLCDEFPHKLGDFALLLNAGMSFRTALLCTYLNSCIIYLGFVLGVLLGENETVTRWVYGVATGMFLYISVCNLIPELIEMSVEIEVQEASEDKLRIKIKNFLIQNSGIIIGIGLMLIIALVSSEMNI